MSKTIILNLSNIILKGDVIDIGESYGVIYNLSKDIEEEIAIDYIEDNNKELLLDQIYDTCTVFFYFSSIWRDSVKTKLINDIAKFVKKGGEILIWDINKEIGQVFNNNIKAILSTENVKEFNLKNLNVLSKSGLEETKSLLAEHFNITEEKLWEDIYFLKGEKK